MKEVMASRATADNELNDNPALRRVTRLKVAEKA